MIDSVSKLDSTDTRKIPRDFNELVELATWQVIEGITGGKKLRSVMYAVLQNAINIMAEWNND